jgi:glutamine cyclotransferase
VYRALTKLILTQAFAGMFFFCDIAPLQSAETAPIHRAQVVASFPHDPKAFTQGLIYEKETFLESTGMFGQSSLRRTDLRTGKVLEQRDLPAKAFGEGLAQWGGEVFQLTWKNGVILVYGVSDLKLNRVIKYVGEGWGLTADSDHLILSNGSAELIFLDPQSLKEARRLKVHDHGRPVEKLNELELIEGMIWANVWLTEKIAIISPIDGQVRAWIDLSGIHPPSRRVADTDVPNGIAYDPQGRRIFITGKNWPRIFEIRPDPPLPNTSSRDKRAP